MTERSEPQPANGRLCTPVNRDVAVAADGEFSPLQVGPLEVWPPVVLAPMAGVTNYPFRALARAFGAGLYVSEMITARGYLMDNRLTHKLASFGPEESPRSLQIYGADPKDVGEMVKRLVGEDKVDHLDMNFGCPVPKVTRAGGGSAIPAKPRLLARIVRAAVRSAGDVPVTIKVRKGLRPDLLTYRDAGDVAQSEGCAAIGLHGRTAAELYSGEADWDAIADLVQHLSIPVLGNGDIWESFDALRLMRHTGCAGVIVGRGCLGRPWLFRELADVFSGAEPATPPALAEIVAIMEDHAQRLCDFFGPVMGMRQMRKWCHWYTKGFHGSAAVRGALARVESIEDMRRILGGLNLSEAFPENALRAHRAKGNKTQTVKLPEGYLENRDDDTPPKSPHSPEELAAWEQALSGG